MEFEKEVVTSFEEAATHLLRWLERHMPSHAQVILTNGTAKLVCNGPVNTAPAPAVAADPRIITPADVAEAPKGE